MVMAAMVTDMVATVAMVATPNNCYYHEDLH